MTTYSSFDDYFDSLCRTAAAFEKYRDAFLRAVRSPDLEVEVAAAVEWERRLEKRLEFVDGLRSPKKPRGRRRMTFAKRKSRLRRRLEGAIRSQRLACLPLFLASNAVAEGCVNEK